MALPILAATGLRVLGKKALSKAATSTVAKNVAKKVTGSTVAKNVAKKVTGSTVAKNVATKVASVVPAAAKSKTSTSIATRAAKAAKDISGVTALQNAKKSWSAGGLANKGKAILSGTAGLLGLNYTKDLVSGAISEKSTAAAAANDPFEAAEGAGTIQATDPAQVATNTNPLWDAPDILPDFVETKLENMTPTQAATLLGGTATAIGLGGAATYAAKDQILGLLGQKPDTETGTTGSRKKSSGSGKKRSTKRGSKKRKIFNTNDPSMKKLSGEWDKLSKSDKEYYENDFSQYVGIEKDRRTKAKTPQRRGKTAKKGTRRTPRKSKTTQQNKMKAAAKKWKTYRGKLSYQEFISKELSK